MFNGGEDFVLQLLNLADNAMTRSGGGGRLMRIVDAGVNVGVDRATGMQTSIFTVITNRAGALVTMHPGLP